MIKVLPVLTKKPPTFAVRNLAGLGVVNRLTGRRREAAIGES
jgi:hypothetical protein